LLIKCGDCDQKFEIHYGPEGEDLEIAGVLASIENWREILLPLRLLTSQLYQVSARCPLLLTATIAILALAALLACLLPARRASLLNPVQALRAE
jgi:ABC-type lipoprotein release transport system permease subunit